MIKQKVLELISPKNDFEEEFLKNTIQVLKKIDIRTFQEQFRRTTRLSHRAKHEFYGLAYPDSNLILIDQNIPDDMLITTIIHECNHVLNYKKFKHSAYQLEYFAHLAELMFAKKKFLYEITPEDLEQVEQQLFENYKFTPKNEIEIDIKKAIF